MGTNPKGNNMASFAPVAPIQILEKMKEEGILGNYHLLLAHHVLEYPGRFEALFADMRNCTIIMDNSLVELGTSENEDLVLEACNALETGGRWDGLNRVIPVLTDVMGYGVATRESAAKSYQWWKASEAHYKQMVVLQGGFGNNDVPLGHIIYGEPATRAIFEDFCRTADAFLLDPQYESIEYVGIPRILTDLIGSRQDAIRYVRAIRYDVKIHLLGFSNNVMDDIICANMLGSDEGIDSAVPIRYSYDNGVESPANPIYTPTSPIPPRPKDWFEKGVYDSTIATNLANIRKWVA
jgi:hypothetical protein